ncbi:pancreatic lipase-related protein 2-like [Haliotis asinina]|uniref:pancreatic lipase-related protein 2-like n=1 Tax=Haliotis asinina TaxID=109174 RepID=UPI00353253AD
MTLLWLIYVTSFVVVSSSGVNNATSTSTAATVPTTDPATHWTVITASQTTAPTLAPTRTSSSSSTSSLSTTSSSPTETTTHISTTAASTSASITKSNSSTSTSTSSSATKSNSSTSLRPHSTTPVPDAYKNKTVCYKYLGCFDNHPPFDNAGYDVPDPPEVVGTKFWLFTRANPTTKHTLQYQNISTFASVNASKPLKIITHGFSQTATVEWVVKMKDELLRLGDFNVITVDWKKGAEFPNYDQAVANTRLVATQIRVVVDMLLSRGLKLQDLHLLGHSLGAHTSGYAGFLMKGKVGRISGLDPAEPSYENLPDVLRLDKTDAVFVDVIHTNGAPLLSGGAGLMEISGHVDFYVNGGKAQPGCKDGVSGLLSGIFGGGGVAKTISCSHGRSHQLYLESMSSPCPFTSYPCPSYDDFKKGKCLTCGSTGCSQLGYYSDQYRARGKMYLNTGSKAPYCGYHYLIEIETGAMKQTTGRLFIKMVGSWGDSNLIAVTGDDAMAAQSNILKVVVSLEEVGDLTSLVFKYVKHTGFWFTNTEDSMTLEKVKVTSGENGDSYLFCFDGQTVMHNVEAHSRITNRKTCE